MMHRLRDPLTCFSTLLLPSAATRLVWLVGGALLLLAVYAAAGPVRLIWEAMRAPTLRGYRLADGPTSHTEAAHSDGGLQTRTPVTGLAASQPSSFAVTAYEDTGKESTLAHAVRTTMTASVPPPSSPVVAFSARPTSGQAPLTVLFSDTSTGTMTAWAWDFGDGTRSTRISPFHTYSTAGTYSVKLTMTGPGGSTTVTKTDYITVTAPAPPRPAPHALGGRFCLIDALLGALQ